MLLRAVELIRSPVFTGEFGCTIIVLFGIEQVGGTTGLAVPVYATEQLRLTVPAKPKLLKTVIGSELKFEVVPAANDIVFEATSTL